MKRADEFLIQELGLLLCNGSDREDINRIAPKLQKNLDKPLEQLVSEIVKEIKEETKKFLEKRNEQGETYIDGISTCIYLADRDRGNLKLTFHSGIDNSGNDIDSSTFYDVASITKLFTLLLTFKLADEGYIDLNDRVSKLDDRFTGLEDFTINDLLLLVGEFETNGRVQEGKTVEEANQILETIHLKSNDRTQNKYNDFGAIVLSKVIERVVSEKEGKEYKYDEIMKKFITKDMNDTHFNRNEIILNGNIAGNGNKEGLVHDPKTRALGGVSGAAGIFTTTEDLRLLADEFFKVNYKGMKSLLAKQELIKIGKVTFPNSPQNNKGLLGMYQKNPDRDKKWLAPLIYGDNTFTAQGFTGSAATYDFRNGIHNSFLVNSIKDGEPKKPDGFIDEFKKYQYFIVEKTMELLVSKKFEETSKSRIDIDRKVYINK